MQLTGLRSLYGSMRNQEIGRYKFQYKHNHLTFECLFFIDLDPFELVMGCLGHDFAIFFDVQRGFSIRPRIDPEATYYALINALKTGANSGHRFNLAAFLNDFNGNIPAQAHPQNVPTISDVVRYYPDVEDAHKIHFCGWRDNAKRSENVTPENAAKTRRLMGQRAYEFALRRNQSTKWTHIKKKGPLVFYIPD